MVNWKDYAKHKDLRSVIDSADDRGFKNKYINQLHHKILTDTMKNSLKGKRVLDLGCGIGRFTAFLKENGAEVIGVDSCNEMLMLNTECKTVCSPVYKLPFKDNSFDIILSVWTLQYLTNEELHYVSDEIYRVLVPDGLIYIIEQISILGYDSVIPRIPFTYRYNFKLFKLLYLRPIMYERDKLMGLVRIGMIPEVLFSLLIPIKLFFTKNVTFKNNEYVDCFMMFKK